MSKDKRVNEYEMIKRNMREANVIYERIKRKML